MFRGCAFQHIVCIPMAPNRAPLLVDLYLYLYEADFIHWLLKKTEMKIVRFFDFIFLYKVCILSLNNSKFGIYVDRIYHIEQGIIDTKIHLGMLHTLTYTYKLTVRTG
jgi:hypothetical protein